MVVGLGGQCCFTATETRRPIRDGKPRTATSTFTQLLSSVFAKKKKSLNREMAEEEDRGGGGVH